MQTTYEAGTIYFGNLTALEATETALTFAIGSARKNLQLAQDEAAGLNSTLAYLMAAIGYLAQAKQLRAEVAFLMGQTS